MEGEYVALGVTTPAPGSPYVKLFQTGEKKQVNYVYDSAAVLEEEGLAAAALSSTPDAQRSSDL